MASQEYTPPEGTGTNRNRRLPQWGITLIAINAITVVAIAISLGFITDFFQMPPSGEYEQLLGATLRMRKGIIIFDEVFEGQASDVAGIREGDELLSINGERFDRPQEPMRLIEEFDQGDNIRVVVRIAPGEVQQYTVTLGSVAVVEPPRPTPRPIPTRIVEFPTEPIGTATLGINYQMVGPDDPFGVTGALVISTQSGSVADLHGIDAGDIILSIDNISLNERTSLQDVLQDYRSNDTVNIRLLRNGSEETIRVRLG